MNNFAIYKSKLGLIKIEHNLNKVTYIKKVTGDIDDFGIKNNFTDYVFSQISEYLEGERQIFEFDIELSGTEFQKKVWKALCEIPYGEVRTYKDIAIKIGDKNASRAVGMANNKNPISIVVPCHRVIGSNGKLIGYASGIDMKKFLLKLESANK